MRFPVDQSRTFANATLHMTRAIVSTSNLGVVVGESFFFVEIDFLSSRLSSLLDGRGLKPNFSSGSDIGNKSTHHL